MTAQARGGAHDVSTPREERLGPYRIVARLGEGGMGVVHLALDKRGRAVALKELRPHVAADPAARTRLAREVETLSRVRSPRVAPVLDADTEGDRPYVVTRWVAGPALDEVVPRDGALGPGGLHRLGTGLVEALTAIHDAGVVHRDVKPGNVLLADDGPVLIDFGIAHVAEDVRLTVTGLVMGTPGYLAPEIVDGEPVSPATDWWGWAATLTYAASGHPPFGRGGMEAVLGRVARGDADLRSVDPRIAPLLAAALSPHPHLRPHRDEVVDALARYARGEDVTAALPVRVADPTAVVPLDRTRVMPVAPTPAALRPAVAPVPLAAPVAAPAPGPVTPTRPDTPYAVRPYDPESAPALPTAYGDPRIGRPQRVGTLLALLAGVTALAAVRPALAGAVLLVGMALARTADRSVTSLVLRRHDKGVRSGDVALAVASGPVHLVVGVLGAVVTAVVPALVGVSGAFAAAAAATVGLGRTVDVTWPPALAAGGLIAALMAWWGPGGASTRRGTRSLLRGLAPGSVGAAVVVALSLAGAAWCVWTASRPGGVSWWPLPVHP